MKESRLALSYLIAFADQLHGSGRFDMRSPEDGSLCSQAKELPRNARLVEEIYRNEAPRLARYVRWRIRSRDEANDLVQEAFERLTRTFILGRVLDPRAYLRRIVENLLVDRRRRAPAGPHLPIEYAELLPVPAEQSYALEAADMIMLFKQAVAALPPRTREVFKLHRLEELSYRDIAERLGISVRTVEWHIAKALQQIDKALYPDD